MNNIIERYIYDVVRRLPENQRDEVAKELNSNIYEMLSDNPSKTEIEEVLNSLGHPRKLASDYRGNKRYLIGPEWFEDYIMVLKIVAVIFGAIALITGLIENLLNPESANFFGIFFEVTFKTLGGIIESLFSAFAVVTLIFFAVDKYTSGGRDLKFDVKCLPTLPDKSKRDISRTGTIVSLILNIIFGSIMVYLVYMNTVYLVWIDGEGLNTSLPLFNDSIVKPFISIIIVVLLINIGSDIFKLIEKQWTVRVATYHTIAKIISTAVTIIFITTANLINPDFIAQVSTTIDISIESINNGIGIGIIVFSILICLGAVSEIATMWNKLFKQRNKSIKE